MTMKWQFRTSTWHRNHIGDLFLYDSADERGAVLHIGYQDGYGWCYDCGCYQRPQDALVVARKMKGVEYPDIPEKLLKLIEVASKI